MPTELETSPSTTTAAPAAAPSSAPAQTASAPAPAKTAPASNQAAKGTQGATQPPASSTTPDKTPNPAKRQQAQQPAPVDPTDKAKAMASTTGKPAETLTATEPDYKSEFEKYHRANSDLGRRIAERDKALQEMQAQLQQYTRQQEESRKAAELAKLKPYMGQHPDYQNNMARIQKAEAFTAALEAAPPELQNNPQYRAQLAQRMGVRNEDLTLRDEHRAYQQQVQQQIAADPDRFIAERAAQVAEQKFQELFQRKQMEFEVQREVQEQFNDPVVRQFAAEHNEEVQQAIRDGVPPQYAAHQIKLFDALQKAESRIQELESRLEGQSKEVGMAQEQQRLLKSRATVTREPAAAQKADPHRQWQSWLKESGIKDPLSHPAQRKLAEFIKIAHQNTIQ